MPEPLVAKAPLKMSPAGQAAAIIFISLPLVALWYCYHHGRIIHFDNPWLNLGVHAALFVLPLVWVGLMFVKPVVYAAPKDNIVIATPSFFSCLSRDWWMMFLLWATPVVAIYVLGQALFARDLTHPEILSTSFGKAVAIIAVVFCLGFFYWTMFAGRDQPAVWISEEGLRTSIARFHEWKDIHHLSRHGNIYTLFNNANPAIPVGSFHVREADARALLERRLSENQIRIFDDPSPVFLAVKIAVALGFVANVAVCLWLRFYLSFSFISVVLISFGLGIVLCLLLEKFRGVPKFGKSRPVIELSIDDDDTGDTPKPAV